MADTLLVPTSPLQNYAEVFAAQPRGASLIEEAFTSMVDLWVDPQGPGGSAAAGVLKIDELPTVPGRSIHSGPVTVIWTGPTEWLVAAHVTTGEELEESLRSAVGPHGGAAVDVSAQRTTIRLSGEHARAVLAKGCSVDLYPGVFAKGAAVQTVLGLAGVIIVALDDAGTEYHILVRASFARYLADWLIDASGECGTSAHIESS